MWSCNLIAADYTEIVVDAMIGNNRTLQDPGS